MDHRATTSRVGRIRKKTSSPKSHVLLPLIAAIINGIQAIDARPVALSIPVGQT